MTFVNTQPGNLHVYLVDGDDAPLPGGCFQIDGPSGFERGGLRRRQR